jgi:nitrogen regulatory protein P-II 2
MKLIIAIIRPERLRDVREQLLKADVQMLTVLDVKGCGQQKGYLEEFRGVVEEVTLHRKAMMLIAVNESYVEKTIAAITAGAKTNGGKIGDGKIFVVKLDECVRISSGEKGTIAIGGKSDEAKKVKPKKKEEKKDAGKGDHSSQKT